MKVRWWGLVAGYPEALADSRKEVCRLKMGGGCSSGSDEVET